MARGDFPRRRCKVILQSIVVPKLSVPRPRRDASLRSQEARYAKQRIEVVTPLGGGISEVTLFPDATAVLAGTAGRFERQTVQTTSAIVMLQNGDVFPSLAFARVGGGEIHSPGDQRALMEIIQLLQPRSLLQDTGHHAADRGRVRGKVLALRTQKELR